MPVRDPIPPDRAEALRRFRRTMARMALLSLVAAIIAVVVVAAGSDTLRIHILIATALGVGLSVLLGTALMSLIFLSNALGHDAEAGRRQTNRTEDGDDR